MFPVVKKSEVPLVSTDQMIAVDRAMAEDYKISVPQMMENAGYTIARLARVRFLNNDPKGKRVLAMAGSGGNGGDALVAARRLENWGADVEIALGQAPEKMKRIPGDQLSIVQEMGIKGSEVEARPGDLGGYDLIIDGLIGFSLKGAPYGTIGALIHAANKNAAPILAVDAPSGVDTTSGQVFGPAIKAQATLTLALPKKGLYENKVEQQMGELYLGDISVPPALYSRAPLSMEVGHIFQQDDIVRII